MERRDDGHGDSKKIWACACVYLERIFFPLEKANWEAKQSARESSKKRGLASFF